MPLEPRVRHLVTLVNRLDSRSGGASMAERRASSAATASRLGFTVMPAGPEPAEQRDLMVPVEGGQIRVRLYLPHGAQPAPLHVYLHGGGWCIGSLDERDPRCRAISAGADCAVASVEYRLAPENAYPTPPEDCYAALCWLAEHAEDLGLDASRISVSGESAGANLAAVVCLMTRDRSGPAICHQWLDVPATDLTMSQPSVNDVPDGHLLDLAMLYEYRSAYLGDLDRVTEPYASPLHDADLSGLPPAWIMSAEFDKLRDDGVAYAEALEAAGVPVHFEILAGHVHPSFAFTRLLPSAKEYEQRAIAALRGALHP